MTPPLTKVLLLAPNGPFLGPEARLERDRLAKRLNGIFSRKDAAADSGMVVDDVNSPPPNPTALDNQIRRLSRNVNLAIFYVGPVQLTGNEVHILTANSKTSKPKSKILLRKLLEKNESLSCVIAQHLSDRTSDLHVLTRRSYKIVRCDLPDKYSHLENIIETYLEYFPYVPSLTASDVINLYLHRLKGITCKTKPIFIGNFQCSPSTYHPSSAMAALAHNLLSANAGSREDGINELQFFRTRANTADEANALNAYFASCDPSLQVRCAAERVEKSPSLRRARTLVPRHARLSATFLDEFCSVPEGPFRMGSSLHTDPHSLPEERPEHEVCLNAFRIGRTPVTMEDWAAFKKDTTPGFSLDGGVRGKMPVTHVSWYAALEYCIWLTVAARNQGFLSGVEEITLPSEAQWEKAARGVDGRIYPWGEDFDSSLANFRDNEIGHPMEVGSFSPRADSPYGVADVAGNVWQWTRSLWGRNGATPEYSYPYDPADGRENTDAPGDVRRIVRGGAWYYFDYCLRCSTRNLMYPYVEHSGGGFRVVIQPTLQNS